MDERTKDLLRRAAAEPFWYDRKSNLFRSGSRHFKPDEMPMRHFVAGSEVARLDDVPLVQTYLGLVVLPRMHEWLMDNLNEELAEETVDAMRDVYLDMRPDMSSHRHAMARDSGGFMGLDMVRPDRNNSDIFLTTLGNCACLSLNLEGMFGRRRLSEHVSQYGFHNVDIPAQRMSLLAGLGVLAHKAMNS